MTSFPVLRRVSSAAAAFSLACAFAAQSAIAAPQSWGEQFGSSGNDTLLEILPDGQGGTFAAGQTNGSFASPHAGFEDVFVVRTAAGGAQAWARQIGTSGWDEPNGIAADGAGGLFVAGSTTGSFTPSFGDWDGFLMRFDGAGNLLWARNAGTALLDFFEAVVPDGLGGAFAIGKTSSSSPESYKLWIVRFDGSGSILWSKTHTFFGSAAPWCATSDGQGGLFIAGAEIFGSLPFTDGDAFLARATPDGDLIWKQHLFTNQSERIEGVTPDGSGGAYVAGMTDGALGQAQGGRDAFVARFDGSGAVQWLRQLGTPLEDEAWSAASDGLNGVVVCGHTLGSLAGTSGGSVDAWLMRFDGAGNSIWSQQLGGAGAERAFSICSFAPQQIVAAGYTSASLFGTNLGGGDAWIAGFDFCTAPPPANYCTGLPNSTGQGAAIAHQGSTQIALNDFGLLVSGCPASQIGLFLMGPGQAAIPFGDGVLCLSDGVLRIHPSLFTDAAGAASATLDVTNPNSSASQIDAGETWNFQFWYRDTASTGAGFNLSNGLSATFCP